MTRFPLAESDIAVLALEMGTDLTDNAAVYPAPPVTVADLRTAWYL